MFSDNVKPKTRGRPAGETAQGAAMRDRLYRIAVRMIGERGYEATTLREIALEAGVSAALLYRYFPGKHAVLIAVYDELSVDFERRVAANRRGTWVARFRFALDASLATLATARPALRALVPILVSDDRDGVFGPGTAFSRQRVLGGFQAAVGDATDAPVPALRAPLGRLLYLAHLGIVLFWLLDASPEQRATAALIAVISRLLPAASTALRFPPGRKLVQKLSAIVDDALFHGQPTT